MPRTVKTFEEEYTQYKSKKRALEAQNAPIPELDLEDYLKNFVKNLNLDPNSKPKPLEVPEMQQREQAYKMAMHEILNEMAQHSMGKPYQYRPGNKALLKSLMDYFMHKDSFFAYDKILNMPSLSKGLLVIGGYGIGKTTIFQAFKKLWDKTPDHWPESKNRFIMTSTMEACLLDEDKLLRITRKDTNVCLDDLGRELTEDLAKYGRSPVKNILHWRLNVIGKNHKIFATSNMSMNEIAQVYGLALADRLKEFVNIIMLDDVESFRE